MKAKNALFVTVFVALVAACFGAIEAGLALSDYGVDRSLFERHRYLGGLYVENIFFYNRYFDRSQWAKKDAKVRYIRNVFRYRKTPKILRGFVLGESAAQGYPYRANHAFGKMVEAALAYSGHYEKVEIVNVSDSAISSYAIRDIARRLDEYAPDFLIVYAGNNEYYGTVTESTGGTHFSRNLYLRLRDVRLFQLAFDAFSGELSRPVGGGQAMMAERFAEKRYPPNALVDQRIARNFVKNIDAIVSQYVDRIPVILVEPVANLADMPPFAGEGDEKLRSIIEPYAAAVRSGDLDKAREVRDQHRAPLGPTDNATLHYLDGLYERLADPKSPFDVELARARDLDLVPFRPRRAELEALHSYAQERSKSSPNLHFVPLYEVLAARGGPGIFSNRIFLDHVHFNQAGHRLVAEIVATALTDVLAFDAEKKAKVGQFFSGYQAVSDAVHCLSFHRLFANLDFGVLLDAPPYSSMLVKFQPNSEEYRTAAADLGPELMAMIHGKTQPEALPVVVNYYMQRDEFRKAHELFIAENFSYPGTHTTYLNLARFFSKFANFVNDAESNYRMAYLLSDKDRAIYDEMKKYLTENHREESLVKIDRTPP